MKLYLIALTCLMALAALSFAEDSPMLKGADLSFLPAIEEAGGIFKSEGIPGDALTILADHGLNSVRLRLWHTPPDGHSSLAETLALAQRVKAAGMHLLLDLHYSDTWADPGHQTKPAAWATLDFPTLADSVRTYTRDVLRAFQAVGAAPDILQLGNEITPGFLWPDGRVGNSDNTPEQWSRFATLLGAASAGVADAFPEGGFPEIMIHIDRGGDNGACRWFFDKLLAEEVTFDLIGLSYYPWWHGTLADLDTNLDDLAVRYGKDVVLVETAYPWTLGWFDDTHNYVGLPEHLLPGYPATPTGQKDFLEVVMTMVRDIPDDRGRGVYWWAPEWITAPGLGSAGENLTWFDEQGEVLPAVHALVR